MDYRDFTEQLQGSRLQPLLDVLPELLESYFCAARHGDLPRWQQVLSQLPPVAATQVDLNASAIKVGGDDSVSPALRAEIEQCLRQVGPWRKGPFDVHGVYVDAEWRSDWKWERLKDHIQPLKHRKVLDVGCGSGYHCWRMLGAGASLVVGLEPAALFVMQHFVIKHFMGQQHRCFVLPLALEHLPSQLMFFDTVFSMGVLYHRKSPLDHLTELRDVMVRGGELVLETLVIEGAAGQVLMPEDRYAKMRNVWFIPTTGTLCLWLRRCGFKNIKVVDESVTSFGEQRATDWTLAESLVDYLHPTDPSLTIEGLPAPRRVIITAVSP